MKCRRHTSDVACLCFSSYDHHCLFLNTIGSRNYWRRKLMVNILTVFQVVVSGYLVLFTHENADVQSAIANVSGSCSSLQLVSVH